MDTSRENAVMGALGTSLSLGDSAQDVDPVTMKSQEMSSPLSKRIDPFFFKRHLLNLISSTFRVEKRPAGSHVNTKI